MCIIKANLLFWTKKEGIKDMKPKKESVIFYEKESKGGIVPAAVGAFMARRLRQFFFR